MYSSSIPILPSTFLFILIISSSVAQQRYRRSYVIERNESWGDGHMYLVREVQPFFRVYHMPHQKTFRDSPQSGKLDPLQWQLIEEVGSDQRLREAAQYWREHHHKGQSLLAGGHEKEEGKRVKRGEQGMRQLDVKAIGDQLLMKSGGPNQIGGTGPPSSGMTTIDGDVGPNLVGSPVQEGVVQSAIVDKDTGNGANFWSGHPVLGNDRGRWELKGDPEKLGKWMAEGHWDRDNKGVMGRMEREELRKKLEQRLQAGWDDFGGGTEGSGPQDKNGQQNGQGHDGLEMQVLERNKSRTSAKFGAHHLPKGEKKDTATWPWQIWPFMPCLTLECTCPLFRGTVKGHQCILPNGKPLKRAIRKEFRQFTTEEMDLFLEVMRRFRSSGLYHRLGMIHRRSGVHSGPSFLTWHREFLKRLELVYRALHPEDIEPILGLPYWDSSLDGDLPSPEDSIMFSDYLLGEPDDDGFVINGMFANWTTMDDSLSNKFHYSSIEKIRDPGTTGRHSFQRMFGDQVDGEFFSEARIDWVLSQEDVSRVMAFTLPLHTCINYPMDDRFLEYSHDYVHYFISGDMQERFSSSNDPIFIMHHGFIDWVWEKWRQTKQTRLQRERDYPRDDAECMPEWHFSYAYMPLLQPVRNMDALSNNYTDHMYEYAPRPSCAETGKSAECGNTDFVWCDTKTHEGHPVCSAKVKPGGNCKDYEWSDEICYKGRCGEDGRCSKVEEGGRWNKKMGKTKKIPKGIEKEHLLNKMDIHDGESWSPNSFMR